MKSKNVMGVSLSSRDEALKKAKVLVHCSSGGFRDYLEYSILDGLSFNCVPLCITPDVEEFSVIEEKGFGKVVSTKEEAIEAIKDLIENYEMYSENAQKFMKDFISSQDRLWKRWEDKILEIIQEIK